MVSTAGKPGTRSSPGSVAPGGQRSHGNSGHVEDGTAEWVTSYSLQLRLKTLTSRGLCVLHFQGKLRNNFLPLGNKTILLTIDDDTRLSILNPRLNVDVTYEIHIVEERKEGRSFAEI